MDLPIIGSGGPVTHTCRSHSKPPSEPRAKSGGFAGAPRAPKGAMSCLLTTFVPLEPETPHHPPGRPPRGIHLRASPACCLRLMDWRLAVPGSAPLSHRSSSRASTLRRPDDGVVTVRCGGVHAGSSSGLPPPSSACGTTHMLQDRRTRHRAGGEAACSRF
jgi:hypothetical protein